MSVLFIDGWDLHNNTDGANVPGTQDYGLMFYSAPLNQLEYATGHITGQAIREFMAPQLAWGSSAGTNGNSIPPGSNVLRVSWFAKSVANGGTPFNIWYGFMMLNVAGTYYGVQLNNTGHARIARGGFYPGNPILLPTDTTQEVISGSSVSAISGLVFTFYEFYANFTTNTFELRINGDLECSGSLDTPIVATGVITVGFNHPQNFYCILDHLIVTDGESLVGTNKIHAIAPTAAFAGYGTLRGNLVMNDASYQTLRQHALVGVHTMGSDNAANVAYFVYPDNPSNGQPWGSTVLTGLQGWGVCAADFGGGTLHMTSLGLSVVESMTDPDGFPIISVVAPSGLTYFSGPWVKSDPNYSLAGHVNDIPRTLLLANDRFLETTEEGCILFKEQTGGLLDTLGVTFAEEYDTDFLDWQTIVAGGIPFESYFITGYTILGEGNKKFQSNYVSINYENQPVGGAYFQSVWDYSLSGDSGRWGTKQQIYRLASSDYKYQVSKLKVRGHGKSMQFKVTSQEGMNFKLSGWTTSASGNTLV